MSDVDLPLAHLREQIASAVDVVVHMARLPGGRRVAFHVSSVDGIHDGRPVVNEVFSFRPRISADGRFDVTGHVPKVVSVLRERGAETPPDLFRPGPDVGPLSSDAMGATA